MANQNGHGGEILSAGNYKLEQFVLHSMVNGAELDMKSLFKRIEIYEDLFSPYITAKLYIEDGLNFPERFPIVGQEKVNITFKTDVATVPAVNLAFRTYKLDSHAISPNGKSQEYVLHLISEGGYFNFSQYCGYSVSGTVADMVGTVFQKHFPDWVWKDRLEIQPTKDNYLFVLSGTYSPFKSINWLSSRAFDRGGKDYSPFLFYETLDGYRFKSLSKIIEDGSESPMTYLYTTGNIGIAEGSRQNLGFPTVLPNRYHKIQNLEELSRFDMAENIMNGTISSLLSVHDMVRKEQRFHEFFESDVFESMPKLGEQTHFRLTDNEYKRLYENGTSYFHLPSTAYTVYSDLNQITDNFQHEMLYQKRKYHLNVFNTQRLVIQVFGDSRRRVGDIVNLKVPKPQSDGSALQDMDDKNLSGQFMVTSIRHTLATAYSCKMELSRNCMGV